MKERLLIITGVNGAGKTTIIKELKNRKLGGYKFYHFDLRGIPKKPDKNWKIKKVRYWFKVGHNNQKKGFSTVLDGYLLPSEVAGIKKGLPVKFFLLDIDNKDIRARLKKRLKNKKKQKELKEKFGLSTKQCIDKNIEHAMILRKEIKKIKGKVINASRNSINSTVKKISIYLTSN